VVDAKSVGIYLPVYQRLYQNRVLALRPLAYWPMNEVSGTTVNDISGNGYDGTYTGVTLGQAGIGDGKSGTLITSNSNEVGHDANVFGAGLAAAFTGANFTVSLWMRAYAADFWTNNINYWMGYFYVDSNNSIQLYKLSTNLIRIGWWKGGTVSAATFDAMTPTDWIHITATGTGNSLKAYLNGVLKKSNTNSGTWAGSIATAQLGAAATSRGFYGYLAHAALWTRALSAGEIWQIGKR
jgi:hypothetical protein